MSLLKNDLANARLAYLFQLHIDGKTTDAEQEELRALMGEKENGEQVKQLINNAWAAFKPESGPFTAKESSVILQNVLRKKAVPVKRMKMFVKIAAAVVVLIAGAALYFFTNQKDITKLSLSTVKEQATEYKVVPGTDRALLSLADGTVIDLDNVNNGTIARIDNYIVTKSADGKIAHVPVRDGSSFEKEGGREATAGFNTMSTPRGGQYKLRLPDGTDAWLNAASSIRYPTTFTGAERKVEITGEVYFEVAKNANMPFKVMANGTQVSVLGTHFNINAYHDEAVVQTTLVEGAVQVTKGNSSVMLTPGQQANIDAGDKLTLVKNADIEECLAWKNGFFIFHATNIRSVMRQVSRWYDVDVDYELPTDGLEFTGAVSRKDHVSEILKIMELTGLVHFKIEGKKIIVTR